jgi:hypothetical protein
LGDLTITRNSADGEDDDDEFPDIDELLSGIIQKSNSASANLNGNGDTCDDAFPDIDELLSGIKRKSMPACVNPNSGSIAEKFNNGTQGGWSTDSRCSMAGSTQGDHPASLNLARTFFTYITLDPIISSDDKSGGTESEITVTCRTQSSETFAFMYCIDQRCCHIVIAVDPGTPLSTWSCSVDNIGVLNRCAPALGPSVDNVGVLKTGAPPIMGIVVTVLLIYRFSRDMSHGRLCCPVLPAAHIGWFLLSHCSDRGSDTVGIL